MPSESLKQHRMWEVKYHSDKSSEEEKKVAKEFLDADKAAGLWQDSKSNIVSGIITKGDKVLVLHHGKVGAYTFPVGKVEEDESLLEALKRELWEELGIHITKATRLYSGEIVKEKKDSIFTIFKVDEYEEEPTNKEPHKHKTIEWVNRQQLLNYKRIDMLGDCELYALEHKLFTI